MLYASGLQERMWTDGLEVCVVVWYYGRKGLSMFNGKYILLSLHKDHRCIITKIMLLTSRLEPSSGKSNQIMIITTLYNLTTENDSATQVGLKHTTFGLHVHCSTVWATDQQMEMRVCESHLILHVYRTFLQETYLACITCKGKVAGFTYVLFPKTSDVKICWEVST